MDKRLATRLIEAAAGIGAAVLVLVWLAGGFHHKAPPGEESLAVPALPDDAKVETAGLENVERVEWTSGTLASARRTAVSSRILARIQEVRVKAGDTVREGDVLVVLESADYKARVQAAGDALRAAEARLKLAEAELTRIRPLFEKGVVSRRRLDQAVSARDAAAADVRRLEQKLREAETLLSYTVIRSPVSGRVVDRLAEPGDMAVPAEPLLRIYDPTLLRVEVPVRETLAVRLGIGDRLNVEVPSLNARFVGTVQEIVPFAEPGARTLLFKVALPKDERLFAGMYAQVAIPAGTARTIHVPQGAVIRIGQLTYLTVLDDKGRPVRRMVTLGHARADGSIEILSGLKPGERYVVKKDGRA
ncbi:MAG: efflux RND transporter periplasmic adaptor subunit [Alphaproteobacteria bacterium]|nr:MAG: efflux RND transporter periplasmic adaptor subunit [Alphaproteobacteria bacterium]